VVVGAERAARGDQDPRALEPSGELGSGQPGGVQPDEVGLAVRRVDGQVVEGVQDAPALFDDELAAAPDLPVADLQGVLERRLRGCVHAERGRDRAQQLGRGGRSDGVAAAEPREAVDLRERAEDQETREAVDQPQHGVLGLDVLELDVGLVDQEHHVLGQPRGQSGHGVRRQIGPGRVVGIAQDDDAGPVADGVDQRLRRRVVDGDGTPPGALGHQRVERIRRPRRDQLVAGRQQHVGRHLEQLARAVADDDLLGRHAVALGKHRAHLGRVAVGVAVDRPARRVDGGVHDLGVREVGPLGARQVQHRDLLERERLLAGAAFAQPAVVLLLVYVLELPVVVEQAHVAGVTPAERATVRGPG
jgi:hypothetical protein